MARFFKSYPFYQRSRSLVLSWLVSTSNQAPGPEYYSRQSSFYPKSRSKEILYIVESRAAAGPGPFHTRFQRKGCRTMSLSGQEGIDRLLQAEQEATEIVAKARKG